MGRAEEQEVAFVEGTRAPTVASSAHLRGLDSIRFLAACWVVMSHVGAFPLPAGVAHSQGVMRALVGVYHCLFAGPAAVMVFFLISGLVIHAPYADGAVLRPVRYLVRRYIRIGVPLVAAISIDQLASTRSLEPVLWSLYAELVYYLFYPLWLALRRRVGWGPIVGCAFAASLGLIVFSSGRTSPVQYGPLSSWLFGLPVWLLGCVLAEQWRGQLFARALASHIWLARAAIWLLSVTIVVLHFHGGVPFNRTLVVFGVLAAVWLAAELVHFNVDASQPFQILEKAGGWSYSLYLAHPILFVGWCRLIGAPTNAAAYCAMLVSILLCAFLFYSAIERPSHLLARLIERR